MSSVVTLQEIDARNNVKLSEMIDVKKVTVDVSEIVSTYLMLAYKLYMINIFNTLYLYGN